jgi:ABC-type branched-subunit amino acid transport system ATPase component
MNSALQIRDIRVEYGSRVAISGISLDVAPAQIVSLVGSNGAGKTSTLWDDHGIAITELAKSDYVKRAYLGV